MDLSGEDFRKKWKKVYNKTVQIAMAQSIIVCILFWGLVGGEFNLQNVHEHIMNFVVMIISYTVSEVRFRRRDLCLGKFQFFTYNMERGIRNLKRIIGNFLRC